MARRAERLLRSMPRAGLILATAPANSTFDDLIFAIAAADSGDAGIAELDLFALLKALCAAESAFDPKAYRAEPQISDASRGLTQVLAGTARSLGYTGTLGNDTTHTGGLYTPSVSVALGAKLLVQNFRRAREPKSVIAISAYNAGFSSVAGRTDDAKRNADGSIVNQAYVDKVLLFFNTYKTSAAPSPVVPTRAGRSLRDLLTEGQLLP